MFLQLTFGFVHHPPHLCVGTETHLAFRGASVLRCRGRVVGIAPASALPSTLESNGRAVLAAEAAELLAASMGIRVPS